jgi:hypothetical protein
MTPDKLRAPHTSSPVNGNFVNPVRQPQTAEKQGLLDCNLLNLLGAPARDELFRDPALHIFA